MKPKKIVIAGRTYHSLEEMPPEVRSQYEQALRALADRNNNGIPDGLENLLADADRDGTPDLLEDVAMATVATGLKIIVDGREFDSVEDLPPDARARYEKAMRTIDPDRNGIPDIAEGLSLSSEAGPAAGDDHRKPSSRRAAQPNTDSAMTPDTSHGWMLMLGGLFILLFCVAAAGAVWYLFLR